MEIVILAIIAFFAYYFFKKKPSKAPNPAPAVEPVLTREESDNLERKRIHDILNAPFDPAPEGAEPYFIFFDVETTGLPPYDTSEKDFEEWPWPVQIAWAVFTYEGELIKERTEILKQEVNIPSDAVRVHKITNEKMAADGVDPFPVYGEFVEDLKNSKYLIAHNMEYDHKVLKAEFYRKGLKVSQLSKKKICTMKKFKNFCYLLNSKGDVKYPKLSELAVCCFSSKLDPGRLTIKGSHNANMDVRVTAKCFFELMNVWGEIEIEKD